MIRWLTTILFALFLPQPLLAAPSFVAAPVVTANPNPAVPLAAVVCYTANENVEADVRIEETLAGSAKRGWTVHFTPNSATAMLPLLGFRGGSTARITISITDQKGATTTYPATLNFNAPALPSVGLGWPQINVTQGSAQVLERGVSIISVRRRAPGRQDWQSPANQRFARRYGLLLGLDPQGVPVWYYKTDTRIAGIQPLADGTLMMTLQDQRTRIIDMLGNTLVEYVAELSPEAKSNPAARVVKGIQTLHHEPYPTSRGTYISMSANARRIDNYFTSVTDPKAPRKSQMVMGDSLVEFDKTGKIIWQWNAFDHLDINHIHYALLQPYWKVRGFPDHLDWSHGNGITFDEKTKTIVMSFKHLDAVIGVAYPSGEVRWILGDPKGWNGPLASKVLKNVGGFVRYPFSPHHPHVTPEGTITFYDNGMFGAFPFDGRPLIPADRNWSRGVEVRIDPKAMTFEEVWTSERGLAIDSCYNWAMGETLRLPTTGNMLVVRAFCPPRGSGLSDVDEYDLSKRFVDDVSYGGRVDQYSRSPAATLLSRITIGDPNEIIQWQLYGASHVASLYRGQNAAVVSAEMPQ